MPLSWVSSVTIVVTEGREDGGRLAGRGGGTSMEGGPGGGVTGGGGRGVGGWRVDEDTSS